MNAPSFPSRGGVRRGFSLVEVCLALGVVSFALLAILGTLSVALDSTGRATRSTFAGASAARLMATLRAFPLAASNSANFPDFPLPLLTTNMSDSGTNFVGADMKKTAKNEADFRLVYRIAPDANDEKILYVTMELGWPAQASNPVKSERLSGSIRLP